MKSAKLEWCLGELENAISLLDEGLAKYSKFDKLWMMKGTIFLQMKGQKNYGYSFSMTVFRRSRGEKSVCEGDRALQGFKAAVDSFG